MQILHQFRIKILHHLYPLALHPLIVLISPLRITLTKVMLDQRTVDIAQLHCLLHPWRVHELLA